MLLDKDSVLSENQAITGDAASTNVVDFGAAKRGAGNSIRVKAHVTEDFNTLTSLDIKIQTSAVEGFGSGVVDLITRNFLLAELVDGAVLDLGEIPDDVLQYVRGYYDVQGTDPTAGQITLFLAPLGGDQTFVS